MLGKEKTELLIVLKKFTIVHHSFFFAVQAQICLLPVRDSG